MLVYNKMMNKTWPEVRCPQCGGLFFKGSVTVGNQEFRCRRCKAVTFFVDGQLDKEKATV